VTQAAVLSPDRLLAGAFVTDESGRLLLLRRSKGQFMEGYWEIPSGHVEAGEGIEDAVRREVSEETGLTVQTVAPLLGEFSYRNGSGSLSLLKNYPVTVTGTARLSDEHDDMRWVADENEIPQPISDEMLGQVKLFLGQVV